MEGFIQSYFDQQRDVAQSQKIMYYFKQTQLPVLTTLALEYAVFNRWFASQGGTLPEYGKGPALSSAIHGGPSAQER